MINNEKLELSCNSKVKFSRYQKNTFGLMYGLPKDGGTCPGATCGKGGCLDTRDGLKRQTCYMAKVTAIYKGVGARLQKNTGLLKDRSVEDLKKIIRNTINHFVSKTPADQLYFRLNYSGDIYSLDLATAWASVMKEFPNVRFWVYTRSLDLIEPLLGIDNLSLYLSADPSNFQKVLGVYNKYKDRYNNLAMSYMGDEVPDVETHRWVKCPEITGKVKNTPDAGACSKCRLCVDNFKSRVKNIQFEIH